MSIHCNSERIEEEKQYFFGKQIRMERQLIETKSEFRAYCAKCRSASINCYCAHLMPFASMPEFIFLMHYKEEKKKVASGRISHRSLRNSHLFVGENFSNHEGLNDLLGDPKYSPAILRLHDDSQDLQEWKTETMMAEQKRIPLLIVLDGTWRWANSIFKKSKNLHSLPCIRIQPSLRSRFLVRRQPHGNCLATIEAVLFVLEQFSPDSFKVERAQMQKIFDDMNKRYLEFIPDHYRGRYEQR